LVHVNTRRTPVSSSSAATHAARLIDIATPCGVTPEIPVSIVSHAYELGLKVATDSGAPATAGCLESSSVA